MVLKSAWKKKVCVGEKQIFFDHDYSHEVMIKRQAYKEIKKALKEKGVRFQTPLARLRIHWNSGTRTYENTWEAAIALRAHRIEVETLRVTPDMNMEDCKRKAFPWQHLASRDDGNQTATRVRQRLQEFRREAQL